MAMIRKDMGGSNRVLSRGAERRSAVSDGLGDA